MESYAEKLFVELGENNLHADALPGKIENLRGIMKRFKLARIVLLANWFGTNMQSIDESGNDVTNEPLPESVRQFAPEMMRTLLDEWRELGLIASTASLRRLILLLESPNSTQGQMKKAMSELQGRIVDEFNSQYFLSLTPAECQRFEEWGNGWEQIIARFGDVTRDVEEMNKCFALGRYSAAMFHALHVAEWGAIVLGDFIGVSDPRRGWRPTEKKLEQLIEDGHARLPANLHGKFEFLEQMNREIATMTLAWRNKVDHAANHLAIVPNTDFTPDVAEHIIMSVRVFMLRLVEGLP